MSLNLPVKASLPGAPSSWPLPTSADRQRRIEESAARALSQLWLDAAGLPEELAERAQACLQEHCQSARQTLREPQARAVQARLAAMDAAWQAVRQVAFRPRTLAAAVQVQALADRAAQANWLRASRLAQAAWALAHQRQPQTWGRARVLLRAHGEAGEDPRLPLERFWTDLAACVVHSAVGQHDEALRAGAQALQLARAACEEDHGLLLAHAAEALARCLLAAGDAAAAVAVACEAVNALPRPGPPSLQAHALYLEVLVHAGQMTQAVQFLRQQPWLAQAAQQCDNAAAHLPQALPAAVALVRACQGRRKAATALLEALLPRLPAEPAAVWPETWWMLANAYRCLGLHAPALELLERCEAALQQGGQRPGSWLHAATQKLRAQVCEGLGELPAALHALKQTPLRRHLWTGPLRELRQQVLRLAPASAGSTRQVPFLAQVAHELRNPLFAVQGLLSLLETTELGAEQRQLLELAQRSSQLLGVLCSDLLDVSSIEAGRFELQPEPTDLAALLADVVDSLQPRARAGGLSLSWQLPCDLPPLLLCDGRRLRQVVLNLLLNGLKFTDQGSVRLEVRWQQDAPNPAALAAAPAGLLQLLVHDTGPGVSAQMQSLLFAGPARLAVGEAPPRGGAGLGLLICRQLLERMGGSIEHRNASTVGSSFIIRLPLRLPQATVLEAD